MQTLHAEKNPADNSDRKKKIHALEIFLHPLAQFIMVLPLTRLKNQKAFSCNFRSPAIDDV